MRWIVQAASPPGSSAILALSVLCVAGASHLGPGLLFAATIGPRGTPELPAEFAKADAVVLEESNRWTIAADGKSKLAVKERILLLTREGFDEADRSIFYGSDHSKINAFSARTRRSGGQTVEIPADLRRDTLVYKDGNQEYRTLQFTFPAVEAGAVLEWEYELEYSGPRRWTWWEVQQDIPKLETRFFSKAKQLSKEAVVLRHYGRTEFSKWCETPPFHREPGYESEEIVCRNVPGFEDEDNTPPEGDVRTRILMSWDHGDWAPLSDKVWAGTNQYWWERIGKFTEKREKVKALASTIVRFDMPVPEKVDKVYDWVRKHLELRPQGFAEGLEGARGEAENVDQVLGRGGGLPDEITLLTYVLLKEAEVFVHPVLVGDRSEEKFVFEIPDWNQARHLMLQVVTNSGAGYLDPACRFCQAGVLDWRFCGGARSGIRIDGQRVPAAIDVPPVGAEYNSERRTERVLLTDDGGARVEGTVSWHGEQEVQWRRWNEELEEEARGEAFRRSIAGDIEDVETVTSDPRTIGDEPRVNYSCRRRDMAAVAGGRMLVRPPDLFSRFLWLPLQETRTHLVSWPYARSARAEITFVVPEGYKVSATPPATVVEGPGMRFASRWAPGKDPHELIWTGLLAVQKSELDPADYAKAREFAARLERLLRGGAVVVKEGGPG